MKNVHSVFAHDNQFTLSSESLVEKIIVGMGLF